MTTDSNVITITKLGAARNQLRTAISLWFNDGDPVSIHTLAHAAYEIIHTVSRHRNPSRIDLLFDSLALKDEYRSEFALLVKAPGNFFKHANRDVDGSIEFRPRASEMFLTFSVIGVDACGEPRNDEELAYMFWMCLHKPQLFYDGGTKRLVESIPVDHVYELRTCPKDMFLEVIKAARRNNAKKLAGEIASGAV
jgi:hypothetical protein